MGSFKEIEGNLITLAKEGQFDVIAHGVNCHCIQGAGLAPQMVKAFGTDSFRLEDSKFKGDIKKLGNIDYKELVFIESPDGESIYWSYKEDIEGQAIPYVHSLTVVNAYTQYNPGADARINALSLAMEKINHAFSGRTVGLPLIGCGIGGLKWSVVKSIFQQKLKDCDVIVVHYKP